ncbi:MAG: hypothetical protein FP818_01480, partial [Rhodocyclaceae bacterium]|nr:hypothetical protein [Rhodocyclaceae bacterium]
DVQATPDELYNPVGTAQPYQDSLFGSPGNDHIRAGEQLDWVGGGSGDDWIEGGAGNDYLIGDHTRERMSLGNDADDPYTEGADLIEGGAGRDIIFGNGGDDRLYANVRIDAATAVANGNRETGSDLKGEWLAGGSGNDTLVSGVDNDVLSGGGGTDLLIAGAGDDLIFGDRDYYATYHMVPQLRYRLEWGLGSSFTWNTISPDTFDWGYTDTDGTITFIRPVVGETSPEDGQADVIYAGGGNDRAWGDAGNDIIFGEAGNDKLNGNEGNDILLGGNNDDKLWGNEDDDYLDGGDGIDELQGGIGNDILIGGKGDDTLFGEEGQDTYIYNRGDGKDTIYDTKADHNVLRFGPGVKASDVTLRLGSPMLDLGNGDEVHIGNFDPNDVFNSSSIGSFVFEDGTVLGTAELLARGFDIDGTEGDDILYGTNTTDRIQGHGGNDTLIGLEGDDTLDGGTGDDTLIGGTGDDSYVVAQEGDRVVENADEGSDTVQAGIAYALGDHVENLILTGDTAIDGVGNALDNILTGNSADNVLHGGAGADMLIGQQGNDTYIVDDTADVVVEAADAGADQVNAGVSFTLPDNVENLTLTGNASDGTGNAQVNILIGNSLANTLTGMEGNDTLDGGAGDDTLIGGEGNDTYRFGFGMGLDTVIDASVGGNTIELQPGMSFTDLRAAQNGNDLHLTIRGTDQGVTLKDYYIASQEWLVRNEAGEERSIAGLFDVAEQGEFERLRDDFFAASKASISGTLMAYGYRWQADGTLQLSPVGDTVIRQMVQTTTTNSTTYLTSGGAAYYVSTNSNVSTSYTYWWPENRTVLLLEKHAFQQASLASDAEFIVVDSGSHSLTFEPIQARITWGGLYDQNYSYSSWVAGMGFYTDGNGNVLPWTSTTQATEYRAAQNGTITALLPASPPVSGAYGVALYVDSHTTNFQEILAGASDNTIDATNNRYAAIYGGAGNDVLQGGGLSYGGTGDDVLVGGTIQYGGDGDDKLTLGSVLVGGAGNDWMDGAWFGTGETRYLIDPAQTGIDLIGDTGDSEEAYKDWFYTARGIPDWRERELKGNRWVCIEGPSFTTYDAAVAYLSNQGHDPQEMIANGNLRYLPALPDFQLPAANNFAALQPAYDAGVIPQDTVEFGAGISLSGLSLAWGREEARETLDLSWNDGASQVRLVYPNADDPIGFGIEQVKFADGTTVGMADLMALAPFRNTSAPVAVGTLANLTATVGQPFSYAVNRDAAVGSFLSDPDDTGTPDEAAVDYDAYLSGDVGNDTFLFGRGDGNVLVWDGDTTPGNMDTVQFGADIAPAEVAVSQNQYGQVVLSIAGTTDSLTLDSWLLSDGNKIEQVAFADGTTWGVTDIMSRLSFALTSGNDFLVGTATDGTILGGAGNDFLAAGSGSNILSGGSGSDEVVADWVEDSANDLLSGGDGDDGLAAYVLDDLLIGGRGNDYIFGNDGSDVILFNRGDGNDWIDTYRNESDTSLDTLSLGGGIAYSDLSFSRDGDNLVLTVGDGDILTFDSWFGENWNDSYIVGNHIVDRLQIVAAAMADYDRGSADALLNRRIQLFDFIGLANRFEADLAQDPDITSWQLAPHLAEFHLAATDTQAIGGDAAYLYGKNGKLDGLSEADLRAQLTDVRFGKLSQGLHYLMGLSGMFDDADLSRGDSLVFTATLADGSALPGWLSFDPATGAFSGTPDTAGGLDITITATDSGGLSARQTFHLDVAADGPPTVTAENRTLLLADAVAVSELIQTTGSVQRYEFWDDVNGGGRFVLDGIEQVAGTSIAVTADQIVNLQYIAGSEIASERVWARVSDGSSWSAWTPWNITSAPHLSNEAPIASAENITIGLDEAVAAAGLFSVADADGDVPTKYEFWDDTNGGGRFVLDGVDQAAGTSIAVTADQLTSLQYAGGRAIGTERVWVRAYDGQAWSSWTPWNITSAPHPTNVAPVVDATDATVGLRATVATASLFAVSDADGDLPTKYEFWDDGQDGGRFVLNGIDQAAGTSIAVTTDQLANLQYVGAATMGSERVWARAWDGQAWGAWKSWHMQSSDHATNAAPEAQAANVTLLLGESAAASSLFTATDPDGDPVVKYEFWDDTTGGGHFSLGGIEQAAGSSIAVSADDLADLAYVAGSQTGSERVWARASDGVAWGAWTPWNITSAPHVTNAAPTISAPTGTAGLGQMVAASTLFTVTDPDGDVPTKYEFWDDVNGGGHFTKNGIVQVAGTSITVNADELPDLSYVGGDAMTIERVWVRAYDGQAWSGWTAWNMQSSNHATNAAPTIETGHKGVLAGDALAASTLFTATDPDGDPVVKYEFWDDVNGGGHFSKAGMAQAAGTSIAVTAAELADFSYVGGSVAATERVWVRAGDGLAWSGWSAWNMTTVTGLQRGGPGGDSLIAQGGETLIGNGGDDLLASPSGNNLMFGGAGADTLSSGPGNSFLVGGTGNDTLQTGTGNDVIAFNTGDGSDTVYLNGGVDSITLGGGIRYEDLALSKDGNNLVLDTGNGESLTFKDWYADIRHQSALNLQLIAETMADFDAAGSDPLKDNKVEGFDFRMLVSRFDQARAANAAITQWSLMNDLLDAHLYGADDAALGGDLAYQYGRHGNFENVGLAGAQNVLNGSQFAIGVQSFQSLQGLQEGVVRLG